MGALLDQQARGDVVELFERVIGEEFRKGVLRINCGRIVILKIPTS